MNTSVWLKYDRVDCEYVATLKFALSSRRSFEECPTTTLHLLSVQRICERPATKIMFTQGDIKGMCQTNS